MRIKAVAKQNNYKKNIQSHYDVNVGRGKGAERTNYYGYRGMGIFQNYVLTNNIKVCLYILV